MYTAFNYIVPTSLTFILGLLCIGVQEPLKLDVVISFPDHGFHLRFDPWSQVLFSINTHKYTSVSVYISIKYFPFFCSS